MTLSSTPLVSVVIATYNMDQYVGDAIRSVQHQSVKDLEIHVVDDGSTDKTREIVSGFLSDPRVHYHYQENAGQTRAKNAGIALSRGTFVGFCDADDLWLPEKLALQLPYFEKSDAIGVVYTRSQPIDSTGRELPRPEFPELSGQITERLFVENFIPFGTSLIRRDALRKHGAFNERYRMGIDWDLFLRLSVRYDFAHVPTVTYLYRIWEGQMSSNWRGRYEHAFRIMTDFVQAHPNAVPKDVVRHALAQSYANRGRARANISADYFGAIADALRSVRYGQNVYSAARLIVRCGARIIHLAYGPLDKV